MITFSLLLALLPAIPAIYAEKPKFLQDMDEKVEQGFVELPRSSKEDVNQIKLSWRPSLMIEDMTGIETQKGGVGVEIRSGDETEYKLVKETRIRGGKFSYVIKRIPCEIQHIRFFAVNSDGTAYHEYRKPVKASSAEEIERSSFILKPPQNVVARMQGDKVGFNQFTNIPEQPETKVSKINNDL